ncbi:MAG: RNA polymerase sigma factor [Dehalococcoidia bacterium]
MSTTASTSRSYETQLVEKLRAGDNAAIEEFYSVFQKRLFFLLLEHVGRNRVVAEDLVQEVFVAALGSLDRFRGDSQLYTWLRSIAFHKLNDYYRRQAREPRAEQSTPETKALKLEQATDDEQPILAAMESEETRQEVRQALQDLPYDYQEVLVLKYLEELPVLKISKVMDRSPKSVEGLLSRARKALRTNLAENGH